MNTSSLKMKFLLPIAAALIVILGGVSWFLIGWQTSNDEKAYREHMETLARTSAMMMHSAAEEYTQSKGLQYIRVVGISGNATNETEQMGKESFKIFTAHPDSTVIDVLRKDAKGEERMFVFVPGKIQEQCAACHSAYGMDTFKDNKQGDLVAVFGVSGSMEELHAQESRFLLGAIVICISVLALIGFIIFTMTNRTIAAPLKRMMDGVTAMSAGDFTVTIPVNSDDEIGVLSKSFNTMVQDLSKTIGHVKESSMEVASASAEISASAQQMSSGAREQNMQTESVAAAVEEMAGTIMTNSESAKHAAETASNAKKIAENGSVVVMQTVEGMKQIANVVHHSASQVEALGKSSEKIGEIVSVINEIADQTNLLALNAAIEAARAGEHGRGFAVVADEVRKLADRTTKSTKEISSMINEIRLSTTQAVSSMVEGTNKVNSGIKLAEKASAALKEIVEISQLLTQKVEQIAIASKEQTNTSQQIAQNVDAIRAITKESSASVEQVAHATDDLHRLTEGLQEMVTHFTIDETKTSGHKFQLIKA
jgi:methyl-accepting chemotaxis protein